MIKRIFTFLTLSILIWSSGFSFVFAQDSNDYTPTEVKVCDLGSTTAKVCWKTKSPSNSEIVYGLDTETLDFTTKKPNYKSGSTFTNTDNHYLNLSGLKAETKYKFIVGSKPDSTKAVVTKSSEYSFTTKKADGTGGDTGGTTTGTPTYKNKTNFDEKIGELFNPLNEDVTRPEAIIVRMINVLLLLVGSLAVLFIIFGGFMMITSAGNETRVQQGKKILISAVAGLILSLLSFSIVAIVQSIIN